MRVMHITYDACMMHLNTRVVHTYRIRVGVCGAY